MHGMEEQNLSFSHLAEEAAPLEAAPSAASSECFAWESIRAQWTARRPSAPARNPAAHGGKNAAAKLVSGGTHSPLFFFFFFRRRRLDLLSRASPSAFAGTISTPVLLEDVIACLLTKWQEEEEDVN